MRVNIISNHRKNTGLSQDVKILSGLLTVIFDNNVQVKLVQYVQPHCDEADFNIFLEIINPSLFSYAAKNIWIPNIEWTPRTWVPYMDMVNEIWVKTHEAERIISELTPTTVRYIGWTSLNKETPSTKNYFKAIVPLGKNTNREIDIIFNAYEKVNLIGPVDFCQLPILHVVSWKPIEVPQSISQRVVVHDKLSDEEYDKLLSECGVCICLSKAEGFGHAVNEAMASGCNVIVSSIPPFLEDIVGEVNSGALFCESSKTTPNAIFFGSLVSSDVDSLVKQLQNYINTPDEYKKAGGNFIRNIYEENHRLWLRRMQALLPQILHIEPIYSLMDTLPKEDALPNVSIVCVTRDRRIFMPILKYSYMIQSYPEEKMELIIVDDGDDPIEDSLIGVPNVIYVRINEKKTIGEKRNIGIARAMYDIIAFMDDDDVYPNNSILERTAMMLKTPSKECAFCSVIPCYDIMKYSSFMNVPPLTLPMSERVSEATLIFTRRFWEARKFEDIQIAEGDAFIRGREHMCRELSPQQIIVSLVHSKNTSSRKIPDFKEANGCHFGFNEKLFAMVSEIGESLKTEEGSTA
jgi:glycosyltransferase involved in cell wall biosynthesis